MLNQLPPQILSLSVFLCQTVLREEDGVISAIRLVDVWYVSEPPPGAPPEVLSIVQANAVVIAKAEPGYKEQHTIMLKLQNTVGEISDIFAEPVPARFESRLGTEVPGGITVQAQLNITVKKLGICYLMVYFDGQLVTRAPITLLPPQQSPANG